MKRLPTNTYLKKDRQLSNSYILYRLRLCGVPIPEDPEEREQLIRKKRKEIVYKRKETKMMGAIPRQLRTNSKNFPHIPLDRYGRYCTECFGYKNNIDFSIGSSICLDCQQEVRDTMGDSYLTQLLKKEDSNLPITEMDIKLKRAELSLHRALINQKNKY